MKKFFLTCVCYTAIIFNAQAQSGTAKDSIDRIEAERMELNRLQERIKAKQDSLVRERVKIEDEQKKAEAARRAALIEQTQPKTEVGYQYQSIPEAAPVRVKKRPIKNNVGIAPVQMFITGFEIFYERALGKKTSLVLSGGYHGIEDYPQPPNSTSSSNNSSSTVVLGTSLLSGDRVADYGMRVQLQLRAYLFEEADRLERLYIAPTVLYKQDEVLYNHDPSYLYTNTPLQYDHYFAAAIVPGVDIGYQFRLLRYFTVSPFIGFMYTVPITDMDDAYKVNVDFLNPYRQNLMLRTGFTVGFTF